MITAVYTKEKINRKFLLGVLPSLSFLFFTINVVKMYIKMGTDTILLWLATMDYYLLLYFVWAIYVTLLSLVNKKATINKVLAFKTQNYLERLFSLFCGYGTAISMWS